MFRYLGFIEQAGTRDQKASFDRHVARVRASQGWHQVLDAAGAKVFCAGCGASRAHALADGAGVVLGTIFHRAVSAGESTYSQVPAFGSDETRRIVGTAGRRLLEAYWGRYVAFLTDPVARKHRIIRDPLGGLPCFSVNIEGGILFFSYIDDCVQLRLARFTINWEHLITRVSTSSFYAPKCAIQELEELHAGECAELTHESKRLATYWHPFSFTQDRAISDWESAAAQLRATAKACTHAWASQHRSIIHRLSGGLDSSTVVGCLKDAPTRPRLTCLTYYVPGSATPEVQLASIATRGVECELVKQRRDVNRGYQDLLDCRPLAEPPPHMVFIETTYQEAALGEAREASAVFDGAGGDFLFGAYKSLTPIDYLHRFGPRPGLLKVAQDAALLTNDSIWAILARTLRDYLFPSAWDLHREIASYKKFVTREALAASSSHTTFVHPWYSSVDVANRSALYLTLHFTSPDLYYDPLSDPQRTYLEPVSPLTSQPVVELCLRIPSHFHVKDGIDRALARRAFANDVPPEIIQRVWKDRAPNFLESSLATNASFIRDFLLGGELVARGLLDRRLLEESLGGPPSKATGYPAELLDHMIHEAWIRSWMSAAQGRAADLPRSNGIHLRAVAAAGP